MQQPDAGASAGTGTNDFGRHGVDEHLNGFGELEGDRLRDG
jgi:hypothetical protein